MVPKISVIIPVYNSEKSIKNCLDSVVAQSFRDYEIVIVDDGSSDNSLSICTEYSERFSNIVLLHQENAGVSAARNMGIMIAKGEYITFLDSDDCFKEDALNIFFSIVDSADIDIAVTSLSIYTETGNREEVPSVTGIVNSAEFWNIISLDSKLFGYSPGKLICSRIAKSYRFNPCMKSQEDLDYMLDVYNSCKTFLLSDFSGYIYYYTISNRSPAVYDYIRNQIKLLNYAQKHANLDSLHISAVRERIVGLLYGKFFSCKKRCEYNDVKDQLNEIKDLRKSLAGLKVHSEGSLIAFFYKNKLYSPIVIYLTIRRLIKKLLGKK